MNQLRVGETYETQIGAMTVVRFEGGSVECIDERGEERSLLVTDFPTHPRAVEQAAFAQRATEGRRLELRFPDLDLHIREVLTGQRLDGSRVPRPMYDPSLPIWQRQQAKIEELAGLNFKISLRTLQRYQAAYRAAGALGLVPRSQLRIQQPARKLDAALQQAIDETLKEHLAMSTHTFAEVKREIFRHERILICEPLSRVPCDQTIRHYIELRQRGISPFRPAAAQRSRAHTPLRVNRARQAPFLPGAEVQIDSSPFDIWVLDAAGNLVRAKIAIMVDRATRWIMEIVIRTEAMKSFDVAQLINRSCTPRELRPNTSDLTEWLQLSRYADVFGVPNQYLEPVPFFRPQLLVRDNGPEYSSAYFESVAEANGIGLHDSAPDTPIDKAYVESAFGYMETGLAQFLPCYVGQDAPHRGAHPEREPALTIFELAEITDFWRTHIYLYRKHSGLWNPYAPGETHSPLTMFKALRKFSSQPDRPNDADTFMDLSPTEWLHISRAGIKFQYREYDSPDLDPFREVISPYPSHRGRWPIHFDPYNPTQVWLHKPEGGWVTARSKDRDQLRNPFARERIAALVTAAGETLEITPEEALDYDFALGNYVKQQVQKLARDRARAQVAETLDPFPRVDPLPPNEPPFDASTAEPIEITFDDGGL